MRLSNDRTATSRTLTLARTETRRATSPTASQARAITRSGARAVASAALLALAGVATLLGTPSARAAEPLELELKGLNGDVVGTATLTALPSGGVHIDARLEGLAPGSHGFHLHESGSCDASTGFESAGGHLAGGREHGFLVADGPHPGDMPNVHVPDSGALRVEVVNPLVTLAAEGDGALLDADGSALMIHSGADDYTSQPSGAAGERVACAEINPTA